MAEYMHVGIPLATKQPGMNYNADLKVWISNPDDHPFKIEYLHFEHDTPLPKALQELSHVAYKVAAAEPYLAAADQVLFGPVELAPGIRIAFIIMHGTIFELYEDKN